MISGKEVDGIAILKIGNAAAGFIKNNVVESTAGDVKRTRAGMYQFAVFYCGTGDIPVAYRQCQTVEVNQGIDRSDECAYADMWTKLRMIESGNHYGNVGGKLGKGSWSHREPIAGGVPIGTQITPPYK